MSYNKEKAFKLAAGITLLLNTKAPTESILNNINSGCIKRIREIPEDFMAINSKCSPKLPNVIMEANNMPKGKAIGTKVVDIKLSN